MSRRIYTKRQWKFIRSGSHCPDRVTGDLGFALDIDPDEAGGGEPTGSCEECNLPIYPHHIGALDGLCDRCSWLASQE
jgi:hypothetical protein